MFRKQYSEFIPDVERQVLIFVNARIFFKFGLSLFLIVVDLLCYFFFKMNINSNRNTDLAAVFIYEKMLDKI